ncbi:MAG TPA: leucyl/phenylalanyl-tRNA--protein transferase [Acidobacteriota bacterium]|nr:leucyl/phenylalanyl-tRNA--protein transferase [Acidobacteriota bacterium]
MPVYQLGPEIVFPPPQWSEPDGLLAVGGDLSVERLLTAYSMGIFPWYSEESDILWWSPDPRMVLRPGRMHISRTLAKVIRQQRFEIRTDTSFNKVIGHCAHNPRPGRQSTWILDDMLQAYQRLHKAGFAHCLETWQEDRLVGGLYGVSLGGMFFGESMFSLVSDASKVALAALSRGLAEWDFDLIDCQLPSAHLRRLGCREMKRRRFLERLAQSLRKTTRKGSWSQDAFNLDI